MADIFDEEFSDPSELPILTGYMIKRGRWIPTWHRRYFELYPNQLLYFVDDTKLNQKGTYNLTPETICSDSSMRNFCFVLYIPDNVNRQDILYLATYSMEEKDNWMGTIFTTTSLLRIAARINISNLKIAELDSMTESEFERFRDDAVEEFQARSRMYVKVIEARSLNKENLNPFIQIRVGSSSVRSSTKQGTENPVWNESFNFEFDLSMRYATVELWNEESSSKDSLLSTADIPLLHMESSVPFRRRYP
jgi:hypothetical protein